jgi:isochorismate pyruvate lyase
MEPQRHAPATRRFTDPGVQPLADSLDVVRREIDRIDEALIELLAERVRWVKDATRFKAEPAQVAAPARQDEVFARALEAARRHDADLDGLVPVVDATFRAMVAACIAQQARWFEGTEPLR